MGVISGLIFTEINRMSTLFLEEVVKKTADGRLELARVLPPKLLLGLARDSTIRGKVLDALLGQVALAKRKNKIEWLKEVARDAIAIGLEHEAWVCTNVYNVGAPKRKRTCTSGPELQEGMCRDVRLKSNPLLESRKTVLTSEKPASSQPAVIPEDPDFLDLEDPLISLEPAPQVLKSAPAPQVHKPAAPQVLKSAPAPPPYLPIIRSVSHCPGQKRLLSPVSLPLHEPAGISRSVEIGKGRGLTIQPPSCAHSRPDFRVSTCVSVDGMNSKKRKLAKKRDKRAQCLIPGCEESSVYQKMHAFRFHVPNVFTEDVAAGPVSSRQLSALSLAACWLVGDGATVADLGQFVRQERILEKEGGKVISDGQAKAMAAMCGSMGIARPKGPFSLEPLNSPAALIHWKAILLLMCRFSPEQRSSFRNQFHDATLASAEGGDVQLTPDERPLESRLEEPMDESLPEAFDSHFHLDRSIFHLKLPRNTSLKGLCQVSSPPEGLRVNVVGAVANFCDPESHPDIDTVRRLASTGVMVAVGLHPKGATTYHPKEVRSFYQLVRQPEVVACGEVGLDHTVPPSQWNGQRRLLGNVLDHLQDRQVLVLHCRPGPGEGNNQLYTDLLGCLADVPRTQPIHLHCFTGDVETVKRWVSRFWRAHFGFTRLAAQFDKNQKAGLRAVTDDRLLIESDAPYFPFTGTGHYSTPALIGMTANEVAQIRQSTLSDILRLTTENARQLYGAQ